MPVLQNEGSALLKNTSIVWRSAGKIRDVTVARTVSSAHREGLEFGGLEEREREREEGGGRETRPSLALV